MDWLSPLRFAPPFRFAIGGLLVRGRNTLHVKVGNLVLNAVTQYEGYAWRWHGPPADAATYTSPLRTGTYADDGTGYPGSLVLDAGSISTGTSNSGTVSTGGTVDAAGNPVK